MASLPPPGGNFDEPLEINLTVAMNAVTEVRLVIAITEVRLVIAITEIRLVIAITEVRLVIAITEVRLVIAITEVRLVIAITEVRLASEMLNSEGLHQLHVDFPCCAFMFGLI